MVSVITGAYEALKIAEGIKDTAEPLQEEGAMGHKTVRHWSYYLLMTGAVTGVAVTALGAVAACVATAIHVYVIVMIGGALLSLTNFVGAYYMRQFDTFNELEAYVSVMAKKIKEMSRYTKELKTINQELRGVSDDLDQNLEEDIAVWENGYTNIKKEAAEIERLTYKLEMTTKKLHKLEELYASLQGAVNIFSNQVVDLNENKQAIDDQVTELANQVTDAKDILKNFDVENDEFDEHNDIYEQLNQTNLAFLQQFQVELEKIMDLKYGAKELNKTLVRQGKILQEVSREIVGSLQTIEELEKEERELKQENRKMLNKTGRITKALTRIVDNIEILKQKQVTNSGVG